MKVSAEQVQHLEIKENIFYVGNVFLTLQLLGKMKEEKKKDETVATERKILFFFCKEAKLLHYIKFIALLRENTSF